MGNLKRPVVVDIFAGVGGLSLGLESAGFDIALSLEIDSIKLPIYELLTSNLSLVQMTMTQECD